MLTQSQGYETVFDLSLAEVWHLLPTCDLRESDFLDKWTTQSHTHSSSESQENNLFPSLTEIKSNKERLSSWHVYLTGLSVACDAIKESMVV